MSLSASTVIETPQGTFDDTPLPHGWRLMKLGEVCARISNGTSATQNTEGKGLPVTRIETISSGKINAQKVGWIDLEVEDVERYILRAGDILLSHINSVERLGNCALYDGNPSMLVHGMNLLRLEVNKEFVEPFYLLSFFKSEQARKFYDANARRAIGQASLNTKDLSKLEIPLPPLSEQQRIASILTEQMVAVERARAAAEAQLKAAKDLPTAYLRTVFERPETKKWEMKPIGEISRLVSGATPHRGNKESFKGSIAWVKTLDLNCDFVNKTEECISETAFREIRGELLPKGSVMIAMYGGAGTIGKSGILGIQATTNQAVCAVLPNPQAFLPEFLHAWIIFIRPEWMKFSSGNRKDPNINKAVIERMECPLPSIDTQQHIIRDLRQQSIFTEELINCLQSQLMVINKLPTSLLRQAFTGKL